MQLKYNLRHEIELKMSNSASCNSTCIRTLNSETTNEIEVLHDGLREGRRRRTGGRRRRWVPAMEIAALEQTTTPNLPVTPKSDFVATRAVSGRHGVFISWKIFQHSNMPFTALQCQKIAEFLKHSSKIRQFFSKQYS